MDEEGQPYLTRWEMAGLINLVEKEMERRRKEPLQVAWWQKINRKLTLMCFGSEKPIDSIKIVT